MATFSDSRIDVYDYLKGLFYNVVTTNYYEMEEPEENTDSDNTDGFVVVRVGGINDDSEFHLSAYGWVRCYIYAYVPKLKRGRLNKELYSQYEDSINQVINTAIAGNQTGDYAILADSILSADELEDKQKGNQYNVFVKSFVVMINTSE